MTTELKDKTVLITGGAGFIGSNLVRRILQTREPKKVINLDALTYAGNLESLRDVETDARYEFVRIDLTDGKSLRQFFEQHTIDCIAHLAAESHVDRSILSAEAFVNSNVLGTQNLLDMARQHDVSRYLQVSTDEVYGSLGAEGAFVETTPLAPNSPYSASKAAADLLVRAAFHTHGMPVMTTRCSNNYGPYQFPEKLIPLMIDNALNDRPLPVYGDGMNVRDWLHVDDHCEALLQVLERGQPGSVYNIGGNCELPNLEVVKTLLQCLGKSEDLIQFVKDRPGHDRRYAIDATKIATELGWHPSWKFAEGLQTTVDWYRNNAEWVERVKSGAYREYFEQQYGDRLGSS